MKNVLSTMVRSGVLFVFFAACLVLVTCGDEEKPPGPDPVPANSVISVNGDYFKGEMGTSTLDRTLTFAVTDSMGNKLPSRTINFVLVGGDGTLSASSLATSTTDSTATVDYTFDGSRGDAVIRAFVAGIDTVEVALRANTIVYGSNGQMQYILLSDVFQDVVDYNGDPASIDVYPGVAGQENFAYANYEQALGFVVALWKEANEDFVRDTSSIRTLIVNGVYDRKTSDSIGVGSSYHADIQPALGDPTVLIPDPNFPGDIIIEYATLGLQFYATEADSVVFEIHLLEPVPPAAASNMHTSSYGESYLPSYKRLQERKSAN